MGPPESPVLHTKPQGHWPFGSGEDFWRVFTIYGCGGYLGHVTQIPQTNFHSPIPLIEAKFYVESPWDGETKVWSNGLGHMTKLATMRIYGKNLKKPSSLEPKGWWLKVGMQHWGTPLLPSLFKWWLVWPWPIIRQGQIWSPMLLYGKKVKQWIFFRNYCSLWYEPRHEKTCFCLMRTTKVQISLVICTVWSVPLLFTAWIV